MDKKEEKRIEMWKKFDEILTQNEYQVWVHDTPSLGRSTTAFKNSDKWIPIISFHLWADNVSIHVKNRCGNAILEGATIGIYKYAGVNMKKFEEMVNYVLKKWSECNKNNPYIFTSGQDEVERMDF